MEPKILIIIPAFNESGSIAKLIQRIRVSIPRADLVVINDGSSDNTEEIALKAGAPVASLPCNLGIGGSVQTGYQIAFENGYDVAVQIDGDGQHDPSYVTALIQPILEDRLDLCIGSRFLNPNSESFRSTFLRRFGILFFLPAPGTTDGTPCNGSHLGIPRDRENTHPGFRSLLSRGFSRTRSDQDRPTPQRKGGRDPRPHA